MISSLLIDCRWLTDSGLLDNEWLIDDYWITIDRPLIN